MTGGDGSDTVDYGDAVSAVLDISLDGAGRRRRVR